MTYKEYLIRHQKPDSMDSFMAYNNDCDQTFKAMNEELKRQTAERLYKYRFTRFGSMPR